MPYVKCRNLDGTYGVRWEKDPEPAQTEEVKPKLTREQQMFVDQLERNVLLRKMITIAVPSKRFRSNMFDLKD